MGAIRSHSLSVGIVGLPNAGKSTLFNSLTKNSVPAENFPFTTIDKNVGVVQIPDRRLKLMSEFFKSKKEVPSAMKFIDIAGLVKGASKGEGLGNQFLAHIKEVDVIMYVIRAFSSETIVHVYDRVNPADDLEIVLAELILKDIEVVEKKLVELQKTPRVMRTKDTEVGISLLERLLDFLGKGKPAIDMERNTDEDQMLYDLFLLSNKKMMYILNVREGMEQEKVDKWENDLKEKLHSENREYVLRVDVKMIGELSNMSEDEKKEYLSMLDTKPRQLEDIIEIAFQRLNLLTFYTGSEKETNAWTIEKGATAKEAAGVIHTDIGKNFITADVVNVEKLIEVGGWVNAKEKGLVKKISKDYIMQDGDYMIVYANS
ncbi:redox-regulated ATPase YchF [Candidatus Dojkabacteria bacterium]|jgi:hypothetical protein|nr:redox-regulated ATPase YchF [Candidatus Dojkabacteria bacterium]